MDHEKFFAEVEKKLRVNIPPRIKAHLKFHNMDNCNMASTLSEQGIREIEDFARTTLHQILQPDEMVQFYGSHFQKKPTLFVFTLGERMHLNAIKEVCKEMKEEIMKFPNINVDSKTSTEKLKNSSGHSDSTKQHTHEKSGPKKEETNTTTTNETKESATVCIRNLKPDTTNKEFRNLVKSFGPIVKIFLARNHDSGICNGFGYIDFQFRDDAIKAIEILNGVIYKENVLVVRWWSSKPRTRGRSRARR